MSVTRRNIKRKRVKRRRRFFGRLIFYSIIALFAAAVCYAGYIVYQWGTATYNTYYRSYKEYEQRREARRLPADERFESYTNILFIGLDEGETSPDASKIKLRNADTIILLSFDNANGKLRLIAVPRGTIVAYENGNPVHLRESYQKGGAMQLSRDTSQLLGIAVHQYVAFDTKVLTEVIDLIGGIDIYVETDMEYEDPEAKLKIKLAKGYQHLDGDAAQKYLRYRSDELGEIGRTQRQQKFIRALYDKMLSLDVIAKIPQIVAVLQEKAVTSAEIFDSVLIAKVIKNFKAEQPEAMMLPGKVHPKDPTGWEPDKKAFEEKRAELFPRAQEKKQEEAAKQADKPAGN